MKALFRSSFGVAALAILLGLAGPAAAQSTGAIEGRITAAESAEAIVGATVTVAGTSLGAVTDRDGHYRISSLVPGSYRLNVVAMARKPGMRDVQVSAGGTVQADVALAAGSLLLPGLVVTSTRTPEAGERVTATVNALTREQIRRSPARTPDDLVRELPGVELPRTSGSVAGSEQILSIRGMDEGRALVLLDNVPLNDPWGEWIDWQRAPVYSIDRVELTEGGGSSLYGNYAMGGVVQLFSRPITPRTVQGMITGGSRDLKEVALGASDVVGRLAIALDGSYGDGGGYIFVPTGQRGAVDVDNASTRRNASLRTEYALAGDRRITAGASLLDEDRSGGTRLTPSSRSIGHAHVGVNFGGIGAGRLQASVFGTTQRQKSFQSRVAPNRASETQALVQTIPAQDLGGYAQWASERAGWFNLALGGDVRYMHGRLDEDVYNAAGTAVTGTSASGGKQVVGGAFVQGVLTPVAPLRVEASLRLDGWHNYAGRRTTSTEGTTEFATRNDVALSPRLGAKYELLDGLAVRGSVYRAFRAPTLSEQYRQFISGTNTFLPNPDLGPEHLTGADAGVDVNVAERLELRFTAWSNQMDNLTDFAFLRPGFLQRKNEGKAHSRGVEGEAAVSATDWLHVSASYNYDDAKTDATPSTRIRRVPRSRVIGRVAVGTETTGELSLIYRHEGSMRSLSNANLDPYDVLDATYQHDLFYGTRLFASVENLTDEVYLIDRSGALERRGLPRTFRLGLTFHNF